MTESIEKVSTSAEERAAIPVWNAERQTYEEYRVGDKIKSLRRTLTHGEAAQFNTFVLDIHPLSADAPYSREQQFGRRLVAGGMTFCVGMGLVQTNNRNLFSYGYDRIRFIAPVFSDDTIYTVRTVKAKSLRKDGSRLIRFAYEIFKVDEGGDKLAIYCEHLCFVVDHAGGPAN